jgi:hypothetical protein
MHRTLFLAAAATVALPLTACSYTCNHLRYEAEKTLTLNFTHVAGSSLLVDTRNGRIEVVADPQRSDVAIEARVHCRGETQQEADERLDEIRIDASRGDDGRLVIKSVFPGRHRGSDGASIHVKIPEADGVELDTSNGSVVAGGLAGHLVIDTSNGRISVTDHDGSAHLDTSNGRVSVTNLSGSLWVDTSNGRLALVNVHGPVEADTSNGAIKLSLAPDQSGPIDLDTSNGSIDVDVGPGFGGRVTLKTSNGFVHVDDPAGRVSASSGDARRRRISVGDEGPPSRVDTSNGSIHFTIAES